MVLNDLINITWYFVLQRVRLKISFVSLLKSCPATFDFSGAAVSAQPVVTGEATSSKGVSSQPDGLNIPAISISSDQLHQYMVNIEGTRLFVFEIIGSVILIYEIDL